MKIKALLFLAILLTGCTSNSNESAKIVKPLVVVERPENSPKPVITDATEKRKLKDTIVINSKSVVSVWLDSVEMEKRSKKQGDDFVTGADDEAEYSAQADLFLSKRNLPTVDADGYKYLKFLQRDGTVTLIKTDTLPLLHTLYLFDPERKPYNADITMIEDEYKKFFH